MDSDQQRLDAYDAREDALAAAAWRQKQADRQRYEAAAIQGHQFRQAARFLTQHSLPPWAELSITSQQHLIADAEIVDKNPAITEGEFFQRYRERLLDWGDTDNPDLNGLDPTAETIEGGVLNTLKAALAR